MSKKSNILEKNLLESLNKAFPKYGMAIRHHYTHKRKPISLIDRPFLRDIYLDQSDNIVIMKSTQCGISEYLIVNAISDARMGRSVLYILPTYDLMNRFVSNRFMKSIVFTKLYKDLVKESEGESKSVKLHHMGKGAIAFGGSNTPNVFVEFPADTVIIDELDRCDQDNILMAEERLGASKDPISIKISNPTIPGCGIANLYDKSDQKMWHILCENCKKYFKPDFFKHVIQFVDSEKWGVVDESFDYNDEKSEPRLICDCGKPVDRRSDGEWIQESKSYISGYQISKIFSSETSLRDMVIKYYEAQSNPTLMQRFYNSELGIPYMDEGLSINPLDIERCVKDYNMKKPDGICCMGIDVGKVLHVIIGEINNKVKVIHIGEYKELEDLIQLIYSYNVRFSVIDSLPETRMAKQFVSYSGIKNCPTNGFLSLYTEGVQENISISKKTVTNNRTITLDRVREWIIMNKVDLPKESLVMNDFVEHMTSSIRVYDTKREKYFWDKAGREDHYLHAFGYMLLAQKICMLGSRK